MKRILVIKLGALGDFVLAFAPFAAIRAAHPDDHVTLLTTAPFAGLATASPWFDAVALDSRPPVWNLRGILRLRRQLRGFDRVYDLQTSGRSSRYFALAGRPEWSGIARGCALPHDNPRRNFMHTRARQAEQLERAGIASVPEPDLSWLAAQEPALAGETALIVPGAAPHRPGKRWPVARFAEVARVLAGRGIRPVVVGTKSEAELATEILAACPEALDLTGQTSLLSLGGLAARAAVAVGNDTGPMHLAAAMGCRSVVLFSGESDPGLTAPVGRDVRVLREMRLQDLGVERVVDALGPAPLEAASGAG